MHEASSPNGFLPFVYMSNRNVRVSELLKREISDILHTQFQGESVSITITDVDVSPDHSQAKVFFTAIGDEYEQHRAGGFLNRFKGRIRHELTKRVVLKRMPALDFTYDLAAERGVRMNELLDSLEFSDDEPEE